jgi:hypothetical protein
VYRIFSCQYVSQLISQSMDRALPFYQRILMHLHLMMCKYCAICREQFETIRTACGHEELTGAELDASRAISNDGKERLKKFLSNHINGAP